MRVRAAPEKRGLSILRRGSASSAHRPLPIADGILMHDSDIAITGMRQGLKAVYDAVYQPFELDIGNRLSAFCHCDGRAVHMSCAS